MGEHEYRNVIVTGDNGKWTDFMIGNPGQFSSHVYSIFGEFYG